MRKNNRELNRQQWCSPLFSVYTRFTSVGSNMLRRQARERREFLYKKVSNDRRKNENEKRDLVQNSLSLNKPIIGKIQNDALSTYQSLKYAAHDYVDALDDEYNYAGEPKIMITTSHEPSARLKMFIKELRLIFPNSQRMNRGKYELKTLIHACQANGITDLLVVHEHRGVPDSLVVSHLPYGPTAFFHISGVVMRHDIPELGPMSEQIPHLIFHNFKSALGKRTMTILKHLFPVPKPDSKRVMTFGNNTDFISFRHHNYQYVNKELQLKEVGPRFQLKLYQIKLGTLDNIKAANTEWVYRPYMNTSAKRFFLSDDVGWTEEEVE